MLQAVFASSGTLIAVDWADRLLNEDVLPLLIPIVAIVVGGVLGGAIVITKLVIRHRERIALIERGIHPDDVSDSIGESLR
jgi:hypothetical protein